MNLDVNIRLKQGDFALDTTFRCEDSALGIFGPSGCGKSTLLRAITGLIRPQEGMIRLNNKTLFDSDGGTFVPVHKRNIGLVFQDARLFPHWSVEKNLRAGEVRKEHTTDCPYSFGDIVDLLNISHLISRSVDDLSGGEKQRISMGRTLLANPRLLLMDEPVAGLDVSLKMQILPFLARIHQKLKIPTILVSHDLGEILQLTNRILLMRNGNVTGFNSLEKLVQNPTTLQELKGSDLTNLITVIVKTHHTDRGTTELEIPDHADQSIRMELDSNLAEGDQISIGIAANQIALSLDRIASISMRNQLPGNVINIVHASDRSICHIQTVAGMLFAEITPGTEQDLGLKEGSSVWILFKSRAIQRL